MGCAAQAHNMFHPGRYTYLDYPDVASIGCPKPMLFYNGFRNLFPVQAVEGSYQKMHTIWKDQNAEGNFFPKRWDVKHTFNKEMQLEAFSRLDEHMK